MSRHLAPSQTNALLESLRQTVAGFAEREDELEREQRNRTFVAKRDLDEALAAEETKLEADLAECETYYAGLRAKSEERNTQRLAAITRHHASARQNFNVAAEGKRGDQISNIQQQIVLATRDKENALAAAEATYENFKTETADDRQRFLKFKRQARASFRGYWQYLFNLSGRRAARWDLGDTDLDRPKDELVKDLRAQLGEVEQDLRKFNRHPIPQIFKFFPAIAVLAIVVGVGALMASQKDWDQGILTITWIVAGAVIAVQILGKVTSMGLAQVDRAQPRAGPPHLQRHPRSEP